MNLNGGPVEEGSVGRDEGDELTVGMLDSGGTREAKGFTRDEGDDGGAHCRSGRG